MTPERTASGIGRLIVELCKAGNALPQGWKAGDLPRLVKEYRELVSVIQAGSEKSDSPDHEVDIYQDGAPGAYSRMVERARKREEQAKKEERRDRHERRKGKERQG